MTEREKIITMARECGFGNADVCEGLFYPNFEAFYHRAQREAFEQAAKLSTEWGNARLDDHGGHACRNLADAIRQLIKE